MIRKRRDVPTGPEESARIVSAESDADLTYELARIVLTGLDHSPQARDGFVLAVEALLYKTIEPGLELPGSQMERGVIIDELRSRIIHNTVEGKG